jgi:short-subunit dehydrogenase
MYFQGKKVWITGASSGIGEALTYELAQQGAELILSSRKENELERVQAACPAGTKITLAPLDVSDFASIPGVVQSVLAQVGHIDILINNAGISQRSLAEETDLSVDQRIMDVNFVGSVAMTKALLPQFISRKQGHIVAVSSVVGKVGTPYRSAYSASKHAMQGFFEALRAELYSRNIYVTIISPGYVATQVSMNALKGDGQAYQQMNETTEQGLDAGVFAQKMLKAVAKRQEEAFIGKKEILAIYLRRFFPKILYRILRNYQVK